MRRLRQAAGLGDRGFRTGRPSSRRLRRARQFHVKQTFGVTRHGPRARCGHRQAGRVGQRQPACGRRRCAGAQPIRSHTGGVRTAHCQRSRPLPGPWNYFCCSARSPRAPTLRRAPRGAGTQRRPLQVRLGRHWLSGNGGPTPPTPWPARSRPPRNVAVVREDAAGAEIGRPWIPHMPLVARPTRRAASPRRAAARPARLRGPLTSGAQESSRASCLGGASMVGRRASRVVQPCSRAAVRPCGRAQGASRASRSADPNPPACPGCR